MSGYEQKDVMAPIITNLRDGNVWTTAELLDAIFGELPTQEQEKRYAQVKRALESLLRNGTIGRKEMWSPGAAYKHYGWYLEGEA